jgi:hypothetical protein
VVGALIWSGPSKGCSRATCIVIIDKFTKWIEARSISVIKYEQAVAFFLDIIHRFGVPNSIIMDNGMQFTAKKFLKFCDNHHIHVDWAAVAHPCTNRQVKRTNDMILQGIKPRIFNKLNKFGMMGCRASHSALELEGHSV